MPGPAIRAWHLAEVLAGTHDVTLASTVACERADAAFRCTLADESNHRRLERWADVAVIPSGLLYEWPGMSLVDIPLAVDIYDPYHLENLESHPGDLDRRQHDVARMTAAINDHLLRGDYFLCATERQRDFWLGSLASLGRVNPQVYAGDPGLSGFLGVVPFGLPAQPARKAGPGLRGNVEGIGPDDKIVLWAGGVYNWFDPVTLVEAMELVAAEIPRARLVFMGMRHPNPAIPEMRAASEAKAAADRMRLTGRVVFFNEGWVPYDDRADFLLDADVGVSVHLDHVEARYSFRTRVLDYIWAGLPMVLTRGDVLAGMVADAGLGWQVAAGDRAGLAAAIVAALEAGKPSSGSFDDLRRRFEWPVVAEPLIKFCANPARAADSRAGTTNGIATDLPLSEESRRGAGYNRRMPSVGGALRGAREKAIGGLVRQIAADTAGSAVQQVVARIGDVERVLGDQGDAADEAAEVFGRTLARLSAEVTALSAELTRLRELLDRSDRQG